MKKFLSIFLCVAMLLSMAAFVSADSANAADFETLNGGTANTAYSSYQTANGWAVENACAYSLDGTIVPVLNGKTSAVGSLKSPTLSGGISTLSITYTNVYSETNGVDITVTVTHSGGTVSQQIDDNTVDKNVTEVYVWTLDAAISGDFTISVTNNSPSNSTKNKDRVAITALSWTSSGGCDHTNMVTKFDENGHWTICGCGDESTKTAVEAHTLTNHICGVCGYIATPTTVADIIACAYALPNGAKIPGTIELTGTIKSIDEAWSTQYNNITLTMVVEGFEDYPIVCFRMKSSDAADASTVAVGNIITVSGTLMKYSDGTVEFSPCELKALSTEPEATEPEATEPEATEPEATEPEATEPEATEPEATEPAAPEFGKVTELKEGVAYKFGMTQANLENAVYYLAGGMDGYYMATTTDIANAIDVYVEATEGGYHFYTMVEGAKTYINMVVSGTHVNGAYEATASTVYRFENGTLVSDVDGAPYWFGTRNDKTYTTMGPCKTEYAGFFGEFYGALNTSPNTGDTISVVVAALFVSAMGTVALVSKKKEF